MRETTSMVALGSATEERDAVKAAFQEVQSSFENFCLLAGIEAFQDLLEDEAADLCGERHQRHEDRRGRRWGKARSPVAFHGGRVDIERPRVRTPDGLQELELPSLAAGQREDWLGRWAMNQMLINVSTSDRNSILSWCRLLRNWTDWSTVRPSRSIFQTTSVSPSRRWDRAVSSPRRSHFAPD